MRYRAFVVWIVLTLTFPYQTLPQPSEQTANVLAAIANPLGDAITVGRGFFLRLADTLNIRLDPGTGDPEVKLPEVPADGGSVDLGRGDTLTIPANGLESRAKFSRYTVESRLVNGLQRYHPISQPIHIEAWATATATAVGRLPRAATLSIKLDKSDIPEGRIGHPGLRVLKAIGWESLASSYDSRTKTLVASLTELPATVVAVDESQPVGLDAWDPEDPGAYQFSDGTWGIAYRGAENTLRFRRTLGGFSGADPPYWVDEVTLDTGTATDFSSASMASMATEQNPNQVGLFYIKDTSVYYRTSVDKGKTWGTATSVITEAAGVYQTQATYFSGQLRLWWTKKDISRQLKVKPWNEFQGWGGVTTCNEAVGALQGNTTPAFSVVEGLTGGRFAYLYIWPTDGGEEGWDYQNPIVYFRRQQEECSSCFDSFQVTSAATEPQPGAPAIGRLASPTPYGTLYVAYSHLTSAGRYLYYRTSADEGATWSAKTIFGYDPFRGYNTTSGGKDTQANNPLLYTDSGGTVRAFWDNRAGETGYTDAYPTQLFRNVLPAGAITPIPIAKEILSQTGPNIPKTAFVAQSTNGATGTFTLPESDVSIPGRGLGLAFQRTYNATRLVDGPLGYGWTHNYNWKLTEFGSGSTSEVLIVAASGRTDLYAYNSGTAKYDPPPGNFSTLVKNGNGTWTLTEVDQTKYDFDTGGKLTSIKDRNNNTVSLAYTGSNLTTVTEPGGRTLTFSYSGTNCSSPHICNITVPKDGSASRTISFQYNSNDLTQVTDMEGNPWRYTYNSDHRLLTKKNPIGANGTTVLDNTYGTLGRIVSQKDALNNETKLNYENTGGQTCVTDPRNNKTTLDYDTQYRVTKVTDPYAKDIAYTYDANNLTQVSDNRRTPANVTSFTYDSKGNKLTETNGLNNTWSWGEYNSFNDPGRTWDPLNHFTFFAYNGSGNLTSVTNPKSQTTNFGRNSYGQMTSVTDARYNQSTSVTTATATSRRSPTPTARPGPSPTTPGAARPPRRTHWAMSPPSPTTTTTISSR